MAITYTLDFKGQNQGGSLSAITSNTITSTTGDFIALAYGTEDNPIETAWTVTNTGTAITWTKRIETTTGSNTKVVLWTGTAGATPPTTVTVTATAGVSLVGYKVLATIIHTGAHATTPLPAGNLFSGASGHNVSQAITPTSSGSALWMLANDWAATNTFAAAANCTLAATPFFQSTHAATALIRPTTQPRTDGLAFTIGETDTGGTIAWLAFEVQAAAGGVAALPRQSRFVRQAVNRASTY